mgnify:FL=1
MIGRIVFTFFFIIAIVWIGFVGIDILTVKTSFSQETIFTNEDYKIAVISRPKEVKFNEVPGFDKSPLYNIVKALNNESYSIAFVSYKKPHLLLKSETNWHKESVETLFRQLGLILKFDGANFTLGKYQGRFFKSSLYLFEGEQIQFNQEKAELVYDKKASMSIIELGQKSGVVAVSDLYFLEDGQVNYITQNDEIVQGKQIRDENIFASTVTSKFSEYHFYERDYYATLDSVYANSPMSKWIMDGFLELEYKGNIVYITDYINGQDPVLILNDMQQTQDEYKFSIQLTKEFPRKKDGAFYVKYLKDLVVMSASEKACDNIIADYKLGKTIALNQSMFNQVYGRLPKLVSERFVGNEKSYSKAVYKNKILQTAFGSPMQELISEEQETISVNCGFSVKDFVVLKGNGNIVALGEKGELACYRNEKLLWEKELGSSIGELQLIDLYNNNEQYLLVNSNEKIHLINLEGQYSSGFPIVSDDELLNEVKFYRWKGKSYFLIANDRRDVFQFDGKGRELTIIKSKQLITKQIDVWASQNKLFAGFSNNDFFEMFSLERMSSHRDFNLPTNCLTSKIPNELVQFGIENNKLVKIDQKGSKFIFGKYPNGKIISVNKASGSPNIVVQAANEIFVINNEGIVFSQFKLPFNEVDDASIITFDSGKTYLSVIDGLENNVYLYGTNGQLINKKPIEGQQKAVIKSSGNILQITTVVDQFIVQYFQ